MPQHGDLPSPFAWDSPERLLQAFRWSETPQGHEYWETQFWQLVAVTGDAAGLSRAIASSAHVDQASRS